MSIQQSSLFVPIASEDRLHLRRIYQDPQGPPVFMLHGSIENGRIFYTENNNGLAPYLARQGYDVFVGDLRGRGKSTPAIGRHSTFNQTDGIREDLPALVGEIERLKGTQKQYWIAHSWGGVMLSSYWARFAKARELCGAMVFFGTKRSIRVFNWEKFWKINVLWNWVGPLLTKVVGYLPATALGFGMDNESAGTHGQCKAWVKPSPWVDPEDGFDYGKAIQAFKIPPILYLAGGADHTLGNPADVKAFMQEVGEEGARYHLLSRANGHQRDYGHIDMLTHPKALQDVYPLALDWLRAF